VFVVGMRESRPFYYRPIIQTDFRTEPKMGLMRIFALLTSCTVILDARTLAGKELIGL